MTTALRAAALGLATGLRSMTPIAAVSWGANSHRMSLTRPPFTVLGRPWVMNGFALAALGEMAVDKLPFIPSRTVPAIVGGRVGWGSVAGAAAFMADDRSPGLGAVVGGVGALAGTYGGYGVRTMLSARLGLPDPLSGTLGDAAAVTLSLWAVSR